MVDGMTDQELQGVLQCALAGPDQAALIRAFLDALSAHQDCNDPVGTSIGLSYTGILR